MIFTVIKLASKVGTAIWVMKKARSAIKTGNKAYKTYKNTKRVTNAIRSIGKK